MCDCLYVRLYLRSNDDEKNRLQPEINSVLEDVRKQLNTGFLEVRLCNGDRIWSVQADAGFFNSSSSVGCPPGSTFFDNIGCGNLPHSISLLISEINR
jgi:hypothetical protein